MARRAPASVMGRRLSGRGHGMTGAGWSILGTLSRLRGPWRGRQFGDPGRPRAISPRLTAAEAEALRVRLTPVLARLTVERAAIFRRAETELRLKTGVAALAGLGLGWTMGGLSGALGLAALAAVFAVLLLAGRVQEAPRSIAKHVILNKMGQMLHGLSSVAPGARAQALPLGRIDGWRLFGPVHTVTIDDRLEGLRDGQRVAVSRVGLQFGTAGNRSTENGAGLCFVLTEITAPEAPDDLSGALTVVVAEDAPAQARAAPGLTHGLSVSQTGDAGFDARYRVYGDAEVLGPAARAAFAGIEALARADRTATREVAPGSGLRPWVVIRPGRLVVLTPLALFDGALEPPLLPQPLLAEALIPAFASDLASLNDHLTGALTLMKGLSR